MKDQRGFSLIEVIITIAIISILGITLLEIFGASFTSVAKAGKRTENLYSLQEAMDTAIAGKALDTGSGVMVDVEEGHSVNVNNTTIVGKLITVTHKDTGEKLTTFVAYPQEETLEEDSDENNGDEN